MSVTAREEEALGTWKKKIISDAKLTPNGVLTIESTTQNRQNTNALRADVMVILFDNQGNALWVTPVFECKTRCARFDPTCPRHGKDSFSYSIPPEIATLITSLDIVHGERGDVNDDFIVAKQRVEQTLAAIAPLAAFIAALPK
jgi:hypothetical protein